MRRRTPLRIDELLWLRANLDVTIAPEQAFRSCGRLHVGPLPAATLSGRMPHTVAKFGERQTLRIR
jgi:hypothetical protein